MSERIEFVGNPLPSGLPGFGGGTVSVLILPGFNTVVAVQEFGPVVNVVPGGPGGVTIPNDTAPVGSDPADPTNEVVAPGFIPPPGGASSNFKKDPPPCYQVDALFAAFKGCQRKFKTFTVCEDGEPKEAQIFIEEPGFG